MTRTLEGIRVLDFTQGMAGPLATMILADYGAEVIRVEPPGGDPLWSQPAYLLWNRGKKSIELDLGSADGAEAVATLIRGADVLVESFRRGEADLMGIGYQQASTLNPALVYFSISAFGQDGPYKDLKPYDGIVNAKSGRMRDQIGHYRGRPIYRAVNDTSYHTAMFTVQGVLAALRVAWETGRGQRVDTSLLRGTTAPNNFWRRFEGVELPPDVYISEDMGAHLSGDLVADRRETDPMFAIPSQLCTECKDGRWIMHAHVQFGLFKAWIKTVGFEWIWEDDRYKGAPVQFPSDDDRIELNRMLVARMKEKTSAEWIELYRQNPDCAGEVMRTTQECLRHEQFIHEGNLISIDDPRVGRIEQVGALTKMSETPAVLAMPAPLPGQHTAAVLAEPLRKRRAIQPKGSNLTRPLEGIVIVELATWLASPFGTTLLADLGARVIKIEPLAGDPFRALGTNEHMIRCNQGKESITLDLKTKEGQEIFHQLVAKADAVMHNFRPGAPPRVGADYETLRKIKPDLVYVYAGSYGSSGPDSMRAAFNPTIGALSGNSVFQSGEGNIPMGDQSPDPIAGSSVGTAIMLGLAAKWNTGKGQYLETSMMNSVVLCNSDDALDYGGKPPRRNPDGLQLGLEATYRLYPTADGWIFLAAPKDHEFAALCKVIGREDLITDARYAAWPERYQNRRALGAALEPVFAARGADEWESLLTAADVGCVRADRCGYKRFLHEDPHTQKIGFMAPTQHPQFASDAPPDGKYWRHGPVVNFSETPCGPVGPYTELAGGTRSILGELGYSDEQIRQLVENRVTTLPA